MNLREKKTKKGSVIYVKQKSFEEDLFSPSFPYNYAAVLIRLKKKENSRKSTQRILQLILYQNDCCQTQNIRTNSLEIQHMVAHRGSLNILWPFSLSFLKLKS